MELGQRIKMLRERQGLTLEELGNRVGVGKSTVRKWELGIIANMKRDKIASMARALDVSPGYLMGWEDNLDVDIEEDDIDEDIRQLELRTNIMIEQKKLYDLVDKLGRDTLEQLNDTNLSKVKTYAENLLAIQQMEEPVLMAAHHDNPTAEQQALIMEDMNLLKKPDK